MREGESVRERRVSERARERESVERPKQGRGDIGGGRRRKEGRRRGCRPPRLGKLDGIKNATNSQCWDVPMVTGEESLFFVTTDQTTMQQETAPSERRGQSVEGSSCSVLPAIQRVAVWRTVSLNDGGGVRHRARRLVGGFVA